MWNHLCEKVTTHLEPEMLYIHMWMGNASFVPWVSNHLKLEPLDFICNRGCLMIAQVQIKTLHK